MDGKKVRLTEASSLDSFYIISSKKDAKPVGYFGIKNNELLSLFIEPEERGNGYGEEVIRLMKERFDKEGKKLIVVTSTENIKMQKILDLIGFKKYLKYESV